ncbi:MAG: AbrB/MazE/SpoVT family DNA-binding domain-containing protein [Caldilineaceae bacterium]|nr:AbrB/MazE/SpoVT family DNA-binding domain-containing protein [Caldilineaceae bacterium]
MVDTSIETRKFIVQVRQRGQVTLPQKVRAALNIDEGDLLMVVQIGDALLLSSKQLKGPELTDQFTDLMQEQGLSLADLLQDLPRIREELYRERVDPSAP